MPQHAEDHTPWLSRFIWLLAALTFVLVFSGGLVTSKGVGLAVPDWPTTFGYHMFAFPISGWVGGVFYEHTHRLIASTVGLLTIILAAWLWVADSRKWMRMLGLVALVAVIVQGVLGGLRVTMLKDELGVFHGSLAQSFLCLLVFIGIARSRLWHRLPGGHSAPLLWLPVATTAIIFVQLVLGATMRHQHRDLAILDFPLAYGQVIPDTSPERLATINHWRTMQALSEVEPGHIWLQMAHRFGAVVIAVCIVWYAVALRRTGNPPRALRTLASLWMFFLALQITLGAWTIWTNKAADVATAHVAVGATILALGVSIWAITVRTRSATQQPAAVLREPAEVHA